MRCNKRNYKEDKKNLWNDMGQTTSNERNKTQKIN
jgi:hypothetical protein